MRRPGPGIIAPGPPSPTSTRRSPPPCEVGGGGPQHRHCGGDWVGIVAVGVVVDPKLRRPAEVEVLAPFAHHQLGVAPRQLPPSPLQVTSPGVRGRCREYRASSRSASRAKSPNLRVWITHRQAMASAILGTAYKADDAESRRRLSRGDAVAPPGVRANLPWSTSSSRRSTSSRTHPSTWTEPKLQSGRHCGQ
jgi:hypothetical protein